jgi:tRNA pseudouridine13 synthase
VKIKQRPEDFVVREGYRFESDPSGEVFVYRMDKQKVSTLAALERLSKEFGVRRRNLSVCGLKDKQGRTEQLVGVFGGSLGETEVVQSGDLRLTLIGRTAQPLSSGNITANRFEVTVRDLSREEAARVPESVAEVQRAGVVNYFDSQGFIGKQLLRGDFEGALKAYLATPSDLDKSDDRKVKAFWQEHWGEWGLRAPHDAARKYAPMLRQLREDPKNFKAAFLHIDRRVRMMALFELQSFVWNEGAKRYLLAKVPQAELIGLRYQAGALVLPRSLPRELREELWGKTFPLLAPDSKFDDLEIEAAALSALSAQQLRLEDLRVPHTPQLFFKHEERPLFVVPGKLRVNEPREDELNRRRFKVNLSFTLPPGAYATLVVRRVLWFAEETRRADEPVGRAWGRPLEENAVRGRAGSRARKTSETSLPKSSDTSLAKTSLAKSSETSLAKSSETSLAGPRDEKPKTPKMGFLERQRRKKAEREQRRKSAKR